MRIVYKYKQENDFPFCVFGFDSNDRLIDVANSNVSFDEAKEELIKKVKIKVSRMPIVIPEPEDIDL